MMFTISLIKDWRASLLLVILTIFTQGSIVTTVLSSSITPTESSKIIEVACSIQNRPATLTADTLSFLNIQSPGFPRSYPNSANCQWSITAPFGYVILLQVVYVDLEYGTYYDRLLIYNDRTDNARSFICDVGITCTQEIYSSGNYLFIKFTSDSSVTKTGFSLLCKAIISPLPGTISTPIYGNAAGYKCTLNSRPEVVRANPDVFTTIQFPNTSLYPDKVTCQWLIETWPGFVVHLEMINTTFSSSLYCYNLEFYDGNTVDYRSLGSVCSTYSQYKSSTERSMFVRFNPYSFIGRTRFTFKVTTSSYNYREDSNCGSVIAGLSCAVSFLMITLIILICCLYKRRCRSTAASRRSQSSAAAASRRDVYTIPQQSARTTTTHTTNGVQNQVSTASDTLTMSIHAFSARSAREEQPSGTPSARNVQITTRLVQNSNTPPDTATPPPPYSEVALWQ